jgi:3'-phosphoadenosine 5'-phosphosulfate sulfotransferase (PAPS reductase)/FAD synthetase
MNWFPNHLNLLEAESIEILREAVTDARKPVMLYSIGKDSSVMLHLALRAFYPSTPPFPWAAPVHRLTLSLLTPIRLTGN